MIPGAFRTAGTPEIAVGATCHPLAARRGLHGVFRAALPLCCALAWGRGLRRGAAAHHRLNYIHPFLDGTPRQPADEFMPMARKPVSARTGLVRLARLARGLEKPQRATSG